MAKRPNPELVKYIEKHLSKGFKIRNIKRKLAEVGHPIEAIEDAVAYVTQQLPKKKPAAFMIVYGLVLIAAIVIFAWFIITKTTQQLEYRETVKDIEERKSYLGMTDIELIKLAAAGDMNACEFIEGHNIRYGCLGKYWEREDCSYERLVDEGVSSCFMNLALDTKTPENCFKADDTINCLTNVASKWNDAKLCMGSVDCVQEQAIKQKDSSACNNLGEDSREECFDFYAQEMDDISACESGSVQCKYILAKTEESKKEFFEGLDDDISSRNIEMDKYDLVIELASENNDLILCSFLKEFSDESGLSIETACVAKIGLNSNDANKCNELLEETQKDLCKDVVTTKCSNNQEICTYFSLIED
jgi:hypothetical protein